MDEYTAPAPAISCVAPALFGLRRASVSGEEHRARPVVFAVFASVDEYTGLVPATSCVARVPPDARHASLTGGVHCARANFDHGACASGRAHCASAIYVMRGTGSIYRSVAKYIAQKPIVIAELAPVDVYTTQAPPFPARHRLHLMYAAPASLAEYVAPRLGVLAELASVDEYIGFFILDIYCI